MTIFKLGFLTVIVGIFVYLSFAYLAQTIKFKSFDHGYGAAGAFIFAFGIAWPIIKDVPFDYTMAIFLAIESALASFAFWRGWKAQDFMSENQTPDPNDIKVNEE